MVLERGSPPSWHGACAQGPQLPLREPFRGLRHSHGRNHVITGASTHPEAQSATAMPTSLRYEPSPAYGRQFMESADSCINSRRRSNASVRAYVASTLLPRLCASAASPTAPGVAVRSLVQSLNVRQKPCGTAPILNRLRRAMNAISRRRGTGPLGLGPASPHTLHSNHLEAQEAAGILRLGRRR